MKEPAMRAHIKELNLNLQLCTWSGKWTHAIHKDDNLKIVVLVEKTPGGDYRVKHVYDHALVDNPVVFSLATDYWYPYQEIIDTTPITMEELKEQVVF